MLEICAQYALALCVCSILTPSCHSIIGVSSRLLYAGAVGPGKSSSVEIFTANLLIPQPGLRVSFTYKPHAQDTTTSLELWCWMEPSNTATAATADARSSDLASSRLVAADSATAGTAPVEHPASSQTAGRQAGSPCARVLAMLQAHGAVLVSTAGKGTRLELEQ